MLETKLFVSSEHLHFPEEANEQGGNTTAEPIAAKLLLEANLWKLSREVVSEKFDNLEWIVFLFFGVLVSAATVVCFCDSFPTLSSGIFEQTVRALLSR